MADRLRPFRIGLGALCAVDLFAWACDARWWLTDDGVVPRSGLDSVASWPWRWSVLRLVGSTGVVRLVVAVGVLAAVVVALGRAQRIASLVLVVVLVSVHGRSPFVLSGADLALQVLAVWWLVLVCCESWPRARRIALAGSRLQLVAIYAVPLVRRASGGSGTWLRGEALERVLRMRSVTRPFPADVLAAAPTPILRVLTWLVLLTELALVLVLAAVAAGSAVRPGWRPHGWRAVLWSGAGLHLAMGLVLRIGLFPVVLPVGYLLFSRDAHESTPDLERSRPRGPAHAAGVALALAALVLAGAVVSETVAQVVSPKSDPTRHVWSPVLAVSGLWQRWELFSPDPPSQDRIVSLERRAPEGRWEPVGPRGRVVGIAGLRWRKLGDNVRGDEVLASLTLAGTCGREWEGVVRWVVRSRGTAPVVLALRRCSTA